MTSSLDSNLPLQIIVVLLSILAFAVILDGFGYTLLKMLSPILRRIEKANTFDNNLVIRTFVGGLFYTLVFFALGALHLLTDASVIGVSLAVPALAFILGRRWQALSQQRLKPLLAAHKYIILGSVAFGVLTFVFWFRPTTNFDGLWYHLTIPKLFLENHDIRNQGGLLLYSLQPSMNYFWNLWPLSLPVSTPVASIIVNGFQAVLICLGLAFATNIGKVLWGWNKYYQFFVPIIVGFSFEGVSLFGVGGNDLIGLAYGLVATMYAFYLTTKPKVSWSQLTCGLLLIVGLATIKVFFTLFAALVLLYLITGIWNKLPDAKHTKKQITRLAGLLAIIFAVAYLPWLLRAYLATGRPLDPMGIPGIDAQFYANQGGGSAVNHWTNLLFTRFYASINPILFAVYSPLVLVGVLALCHKKIRSVAANLWLLAFLGFLIVFFASITLAWRYYLPQATILTFLGVAALIALTKDFDAFGRIMAWGVVAALVVATGLRVFYTTSATAANDLTDAGIERTLYVRHFRGLNYYLDRKITADYDYVQEQIPRGLTPNEKIFVGNTYQPIPLLTQPLSPYDQSNIHNLAYIRNPVLESTMNPRAFENIKNVDQFISLLKENNIRYILSRKDIRQVCQFIGVQDPQACDDPAVFKPALTDTMWNVRWYKLEGNY